MYPLLNDNCILDEKNNSVELNGISFTMSEHLYYEVVSADGYHKLNIPTRLKRQLVRNKILQVHRITFEKGKYWSLVILFPKLFNRLIKGVCEFYTTYMNYMTFASLFFGLMMIYRDGLFLGWNINPFYILIGHNLMIFFHELGHYMAANAVSDEILHIRLKYWTVLGVGGYFTHRGNNNRNDYIISSAGIKMTIILFGVLILLRYVFPNQAATYTAIAIIYLSSSLCNLYPAKDSDGKHMLEARFGVKTLRKLVKVKLSNLFRLLEFNRISSSKKARNRHI